MSGPGRVCAIHQPHYLPWLRYFDKIAKAQVFVVLDDAQYNKNGWQNRNRIKGHRGPELLTVPVSHRYQSSLLEVRIASQSWRRAHLMAIRTSYARSPGFEQIFPVLDRLLASGQERLVDLNLTLLAEFLALLRIETPWVRSSELGVPGAATERLIGLCRAVGATTYLTGEYARDAYLDEPLLRAAGLDVAYHRWQAPSYPQAHASAGFVPDLSIVDLLASEPFQAAAILAGAGSVEPASAPTPR